MKKRILKIWGIGLTLVLVASLFGFALPVSAAVGNMAWKAQPLPTSTYKVLANGSDVTDIAVAGDGSTVYAIDANVSCNVSGAILYSTNSGSSFTACAIPTDATGGPPVAISVAPDNPDAIAVIENITIDLVHTSNDGGVTWSTLPAFGTNWASSVALDVAVAPARSSILLGREYAVAVSDLGGSATATAGQNGDVLIIGATADWQSAGKNETTPIMGTYDYVAVAFTPNFVGDRCVVAVGSDNSTGAAVQVINTATRTLASTTTALTGVSIVDYDTTSPAATSIVSADIALPSDFDATTSSGQRSYIAVATAATFTDADVYRVDGTTSWDLDGAGTTESVKSVAYSGTIDEGTLFIGMDSSSNVGKVRYTTNAAVSIPTWVTCKKYPTGTSDTVVRLAADFASTSKVFAATTGAGSAFSVSSNAAVSFDGKSMIDLGSDNVVQVQDIAITSDGSTIFVATDNGTNISLWKSSLVASPYSWSRVYDVVATTGMVRLNPDWADAPVVYFANVASAGYIYRSSNGGDIFARRQAPAAYTLTDLAVEDADTVYIGDANGSVRKSTTGAWTWGTAKATNAGAIFSMASAGVDNLLVGGTGACAYSTNGADSFSKITASGANYPAILPDEDYANNSTFYVGSSIGDILRFIIGTDTSLVDIVNPSAVALVGLAMNNGTLYGMSAAACDRTLNPHKAAGTVRWGTMDASAPSSIASFAAVNNVAYAARTTAALPAVWAYSDFLATAKPVLTGPGDGTTVGVDPATGRADLVTLAWDSMGTGQGLVDQYQLQICKKAEGWGASSVLPTSLTGLSVISATLPQGSLVAGGSFPYTLLANTEYLWRIRAFDQVSNDAIKSNFSDAYTLKVQAGTVVQQPHAGPIILGPQGGATDASLRPGFAWAPISGATKYEFILATDAGLTKAIAGTPVTVSSPSWQPGEDLAYSTVYFWAVKAVEPTESPQSIGTFTTMAKAVAPAPPVTVKEVPAPIINIPATPTAPAPTPITPAFIWAIVIIGAVLIIAVIVLIVRTRRPM